MMVTPSLWQSISEDVKCSLWSGWILKFMVVSTFDQWIFHQIWKILPLWYYRYVVDESNSFFSLLISWCILIFGRIIFLRCGLFCCSLFLILCILILWCRFLGSFIHIFWEILFLCVDFFFGASVLFSAEIHPFLNYGDSLYKLLIWMKLPKAMTAFNPYRNVAFNHFLSFGILACMIFLIAIMDKPMQYLRSSINLMITD